MSNFFHALAPSSDPRVAEKVAIATAFHDLGIWTAGTLDYLPPSMELARAYLSKASRVEWVEEIDEMILWHHKLTPRRASRSRLAEPFRRADLADFSMGALRSGLPRSLVRERHAAFPDAGFHARLVKLVCARVVRHPLSPLPMMRL